uniref:AMP-dependent synthetase/ligase domain-containing protein n=1 Tax=Percolomonas cosmopolitus TaxID=63605 RepID=A0A7S1PG71_9EUKA|eukprot:CAMPEP_0117449438 /NCGR_PEP_ID=MMETSP0759-20121206/7946_1 /TAXON_ID=63605 /ORGANISM="Percolomonas cosmopolitus, Strain WS" /LENGTH=478 /DNA_ID=CAMNT_0005241915 /DNA_START=37 /DNA_END=1473 /DNA_ORIENTATION=+
MKRNTPQQLFRSVQKAFLSQTLPVPARFYATTVGQEHSTLTGDNFPASSNTFGWHHAKATRDLPYGNSLRVSYNRTSMSNYELKTHYEGVAAGLVECGVRPGDRVMMVQQSNAEVIVTQLACMKIGASLVLIPNSEKAGYMMRMINLIRPRVLMTPSKYDNVDYLRIFKHIVPEIKRLGQYNLPFRSRRFPFLKQIIVTDPFIKKMKLGAGLHKFIQMVLYGPTGFYESPLRRLALHINSDYPALILADGTDPWSTHFKPLVYSQKNLINAGLVLGKLLGVEQSDRILVAGGHHMTTQGAVLANFSAIMNQATVVIPSMVFDLDAVLRQLQIEQISIAFFTAQELSQVVSHPSLSKLKLDHLKKVVVVGDAPNKKLIQNAKDSLGVEAVHHVDGLDEHSGVLFFDGEILPGTDVKVVREDGKVVHHDTTGYVKVRSPLTPLGYWNDIGLMKDDYDTEGWYRIPDKMGKISKAGKLDWA